MTDTHPMTDPNNPIAQVEKNIDYNCGFDDGMTMQLNRAESLAAEVAYLRERLELTGEFTSGPDGIECRNDTIALQDAHIARLETKLAKARTIFEKTAEYCPQCSGAGAYPVKHGVGAYISCEFCETARQFLTTEARDVWQAMLAAFMAEGE